MNLTMFPNWLLPTFALAPSMLWMFLGVGTPWALAILPYRDWRKWVTVVAVALALGPALTTTAMFVIGTVGHFSVADVLAATVILFLVGVILALRNRTTTFISPTPDAPVQPLRRLDVTLIIVLFVSVLLRFWNTAYWPYTTYDEFWVYGYNARIFMLRGAIPSTMGYYPQLVPLTYTYSQLMWGGINDHAARVAVPIFALASGLMAYVLGTRTFNRRVGLLAAAIWMLYPQHAAWNQFGDLEVPVTLYFTGTVAFFVAGWQVRERRYLILSGLLLGAALWTKPTAGALIESVVLIGVVTTLWRLRNHTAELTRNIREALATPGIRDTLLVLLVALPIGGMWYIRNMAFGLPPLILPAGYWQTQAQRSGQELGWPLLIALAITLIVAVRTPKRLPAALIGLLLMLVVSLRSALGGQIPSLSTFSQMMLGAVPPFTVDHLSVIEALAITLGAALLAWAALPLWRQLASPVKVTVLLLLAFIGPYFVTWFWSYSYHYRLSFAMVPLFAVLLAALLSILLSHVLHGKRWLRQVAVCVIVCALALPGWLASVSGLESAVMGTLPTDRDRMAQGNAALIGLVDYLTDRRDPNRYPLKLNRPMRISAPGELRLPFFFPTDDIRTADPAKGEAYPTRFDEIRDVDFFVDSSVGQRLYIENNKCYNQALSSLIRAPDVTQRLFTIDDHNFRFSVYDVDNAGRYLMPTPNGPLNVQIGDFAFLSGYDLSTAQNPAGSNVGIRLWWQALGPSDLDYSVFIHFWDAKNQRLAASLGGEPVSGMWAIWNREPDQPCSLAYHTRLWQGGETIKDEWKIVVPDIPLGTYELRVGLYDPVSNRRLPITKGGKVIGDSIRLYDFTVVPNQ